MTDPAETLRERLRQIRAVREHYEATGKPKRAELCNRMMGLIRAALRAYVDDDLRPG